QRRGFGDRPRLGGFHPPPENQGPRLDVRCWLVHRLDDVDRPRPVFPGVRRPGRADRLQARQDLGPAEADRLRGAVRPLRLQGAPSPGGPAPCEKGRGPDPHPRGRHGAGRGPARLPFRRPHGRRQPDRRDDGTEDRGTLLATHEPGRQAADPARGPHRRRAGLGRSHAVRLRGGDVVMSERIKKWPGVELSAADLNEGKVTQTRLRPNAKYAWSAGEALPRILGGVVSSDGASPKMGMMHYFGDMTKEQIRIGMRVKAVWRPWEERRGSVLDIRHFGPLKEDAK